jgi:hypothetical protein
LTCENFASNQERSKAADGKAYVHLACSAASAKLACNPPPVTQPAAAAAAAAAGAGIEDLLTSPSLSAKEAREYLMGADLVGAGKGEYSLHSLAP